MTTFPVANYWNNAGRTEAEQKVWGEDFLAAVKQLLGGAAQTTLTLASDQITPTGAFHLVDTQAAAATDDLAQILQTNLPDGSFLMLALANAAHNVVLKHNVGGTGKLALVGGVDVTLDLTTSYVIFQRNGTIWEERNRFYGADLAAHRAFYDTPGLTVPNTFTKRQLFARGADIASAATLTPGTDGNYFHVTGTVGVTAIASLQAGTRIAFEFDSAGVVITHNATTLIMQSGRSYTSAAGDTLEFVSEGGGNWRQILGPSSPTDIGDVFTISEDFITGQSTTANTTNIFTYIWLFMNNNSATITHPVDGIGSLALRGSASGNSGVQMVNDATNLFSSTAVNPVIRFRFSRVGASATSVRNVGLGDAMPAGSAPLEGIFVQVTTGNYQGVCSTGGVQTILDLGVASVDGVYAKFEIRVTPALVTFFVNGVNRGTISTHIPSGAMGPVAYFWPNGINLIGQGMNIDYFECVGVRA